MAGYVTARGVFVEAGGVMHRLPATKTPVREWVVELLPCPHCGAVGGCDCIDWLEWMAAVGYPPKEGQDAA